MARSSELERYGNIPERITLYIILNIGCFVPFFRFLSVQDRPREGGEVPRTGVDFRFDVGSAPVSVGPL
jgi:hypothetical protein